MFHKLADCLVSGITKNVQGAPVARVKIIALKTILSGSVIQYKQKTLAISDDDGVVEFVLPRNARVWIHGAFFIGATDFSPRQGVAVDVPDAATATLESLGAAVTGPTTGVTVQDNGSALAHLISTFNFRNGFTITETPTGVARIDADAAAAGAWGGITGTLSDQTDLQSALNLKANLASPALTGTPTAPTASGGTNTTQIATTAFVKSAVDVVLGGVSSAFDTLSEIATELALKAPIASPTFTGTVSGISKSMVGLGNVANSLQLVAASNLSDLVSASTARTNLGLGTLATVSPTGTPDGTKFLRDDNSWQSVVSAPAGSDTQVQFNDSSAFGGDAGLVFNKTTGKLTVAGSILTGSGAVNSNTIPHPEEEDATVTSEQKVFIDHVSTTPAPAADFWAASMLVTQSVELSANDDGDSDTIFRSGVGAWIDVPDTNDKDFNPQGHLIGVSGVVKYGGTGSTPKIISVYANSISNSPVETIYGTGTQVLLNNNATYAAGIGIFAESDAGTVGELVGADVYISPSGSSLVTDAFGVRISHVAVAAAATNLYGLCIEDFSAAAAVTRNENFRSKGANSINVFEGAAIHQSATPPTLTAGQFTFTLDAANFAILFSANIGGTAYEGAIPLAEVT